MSLQNKISEDARKKDITKRQRDALKIILGELQRQTQKELPDSEVVKIIRKLVGYEKEMGDKKDQEYIDCLEHYLPEEATDQEIRDWIQNNINFAEYKNKMQSMKDILAHFGSRTDGNRVKQILSEFDD